MNLQLSFNIVRNPSFVEGVFCGFGESSELNIRPSALNCVDGFFYGFFDWFSNPSHVAHLATEKEQSRESIELTALQCAIFLFPNTSIKQFLPVLALSTLTTSDLEITSIRIVTPVAIRPIVNTAGEVLSGEETLLCERSKNLGGSF